MVTPKQIAYTGGQVVLSPVVCVWDDLHNERPGMFRGFWGDGPNATSGSPVIGYCSPGGSHKTIGATAREVWRLYPDAKVYRNGREVRPGR